MEGLCPCGHEPRGSIVPVSYLVRLFMLQGTKKSYNFSLSSDIRSEGSIAIVKIFDFVFL